MIDVKEHVVSLQRKMNDAVTIIVGAGAVLDFDHKGIFPSVKNITDEVLKLSIQKVDGGERPLLCEIKALQILSVDSPHKSASQISSCNGTRRTAGHVHP